jgi:hypothetical protein
MCLDRGLRLEQGKTAKEVIWWENLHRLKQWLTLGIHADQGAWAIVGAWQGVYLTMCTDWDITDVRDFEILNEMFSVIVPNKKKMAENPTLKDAYEEYNNAKLIEPKYNSEEYRTAYEQYKLLETLVKEEHDNS